MSGGPVEPIRLELIRSAANPDRAAIQADIVVKPKRPTIVRETILDEIACPATFGNTGHASFAQHRHSAHSGGTHCRAHEQTGPTACY